MPTLSQQKVRLFLQDYMGRTGGVPPTMDEVRCHMGWSSRGGEQRIFRALEEQGYVRRLKYKARAVEILRPVKRAQCFRYDSVNERFVFVRTVYVS